MDYDQLMRDANAVVIKDEGALKKKNEGNGLKKKTENNSDIDQQDAERMMAEGNVIVIGNPGD